METTQQLKIMEPPEAPRNITLAERARLRPPKVGRHIFYAGEEVVIKRGVFRIKSMNRTTLRLRLQAERVLPCYLMPGEEVRVRNSTFTVRKFDGRNLKLKLGIVQAPLGGTSQSNLHG